MSKIICGLLRSLKEINKQSTESLILQASSCMFRSCEEGRKKNIRFVKSEKNRSSYLRLVEFIVEKVV